MSHKRVGLLVLSAGKSDRRLDKIRNRRLNVVKDGVQNEKHSLFIP